MKVTEGTLKTTFEISSVRNLTFSKKWRKTFDSSYKLELECEQKLDE